MVRTIAKTTFDAHTDPIFQNLGVLKFHDIYLIQLGFIGLFMYSYQNHTLALKFHCKFRDTQREHSSKPLKHSIVKRILVFKR